MPRQIDFKQLDKKWPTVPRVESRYLSRIPTICGFVGSTGSGKSVMAISLIQMLRREGSITRVFIISPTAASMQSYNAISTDPERDWKIGLGPTIFQDLKRIEDACEADAKVFCDDMAYALAYKKYTEGDNISQHDEFLLEQRGYKEVVPKRPSPAIFLDDCQSGPIFNNSHRNEFTSLVLRSRHVGMGTGLSIFIAAQTSRGVPRGLRLNFTHLFLWRTQSIREKKILYEEVGSMMSEEEFDRKLDLYTALPYSYMFVDLWNKTISDSF
jgi:hypothetical protein